MRKMGKREKKKTSKRDRKEIKVGQTELDTASALQRSVTAAHTLFKLEDSLVLVVH